MVGRLFGLIAVIAALVIAIIVATGRSVPDGVRYDAPRVLNKSDSSGNGSRVLAHPANPPTIGSAEHTREESGFAEIGHNIELQFVASGSASVRQLCLLDVLVRSTMFPEDVVVEIVSDPALDILDESRARVRAEKGKWKTAAFRIMPTKQGQWDLRIQCRPAGEQSGGWRLTSHLVLDTLAQRVVGDAPTLRGPIAAPRQMLVPRADPIGSVMEVVPKERRPERTGTAAQPEADVPQIDGATDAEDTEGTESVPHQGMEENEFGATPAGPPAVQEWQHDPMSTFFPAVRVSPRFPSVAPGFEWMQATTCSIRLTETSDRQLALLHSFSLDASPAGKVSNVPSGVLPKLDAAGLKYQMLAGVTHYVLRRSRDQTPAEVGSDNEADLTQRVEPQMALATGITELSSGVVDMYIEDNTGNGQYHRLRDPAAPGGSWVTNLQYRTRIEDEGDGQIYCADYELWLFSGAVAWETRVYDNLGGATDGGYDDDAADDYDIYLNWRNTHYFDGEDPNQWWGIICYDNWSSDDGQMNYIEFKVHWQNAPDPPDLYDEGDPFRSFSPQSVTEAQGDAFEVHCDVRNGGGDSGSFAVDFYASTNTTITTSDYFIGRVNMSSIPGGSYGNADWSGSFPTNIPDGAYWVGWLIDADNQVSESNESNNTAYKESYQLTVEPGINLDPFTISGRFVYSDRAYNAGGFTGARPPLPIRYATVEVWEDSLIDYRLDDGTVYTSANGNWSFLVPNNVDDFAHTPGRDIYVKCLAETAAAIVKQQSSGQLYVLQGPMIGNWQGGDMWYDNDPDDGTNYSLVPSDDEWSGAFNIMDSIIEVFGLLSNHGHTMPQIQARYRIGGSGGSYYSGGTVHLYGATGDPDDGFDDCIIIHEYGHFFTDSLSSDKSPGGGHCSGCTFNNYYQSRPSAAGGPLTLLQARRLVWSESFATLLSSATRDEAYYLDTRNVNLFLDIESPGAVTGDDCEGAVSAVLWDVNDPAGGEAHDNLSAGADEMLTIVTDSGYFGASTDCYLRDLYDGWIGYGFGSLQALRDVFADRAIVYWLLPADLYDDGENWRSFSPQTVTQGQGEWLEVNCDIRNGGEEASGTFAVDYYASTNTSITTSDYFIGRVGMSSIPAGSYGDADWLGAFPGSIPIGVYWVGWIIDADNDVSEDNETNNTAYKEGYRLTVRGCGDESCDGDEDPCSCSEDCPGCCDDSDCDDGAFCNGDEICIDGACTSNENPCGGATAVCCEGSNTCEEECCLDSECPDDGQFCNGDEVCAGGRCMSDGYPCGGATPLCCEDSATCAAECCYASECAGDGVFCNGEEVCISGNCTSEGDPCGGLTPMCCEGAATCAPECCSDANCAAEYMCDRDGYCVACCCPNPGDCCELFGDVVGVLGIPSPGSDCDVNLFDLLCVLNCSADSSGLTCPQSDLVGFGGSCGPDGTCDLFDILAVLNASAGTYQCSHPCPRSNACGQPMDVTKAALDPTLGYDGRVSPVDWADLSVEPASDRVRPGGVVTVDVYIGEAFDVRGYQVAVEAASGKRGELVLEQVSIDSERADYVFGDAEAVSSTAESLGRAINVLVYEGVQVEGRKYLATFVFRASRDAAGIFELRVRMDGTLLTDSSDEPFGLAFVPPAMVEVVAARDVKRHKR